MAIATVTASTAAYLRLGSRALQFVCCLFALAFTAAAFKSFNASVSAQLGSPSATFTILMAYTGMLYALFHVGAIEVFHLFPRMQPFHEQIADAVLAVVLLIAGICLAASDYTSDCDTYDYYFGALRCGNLKAGVAFTFIGMFFFLLSLALTFVGVGESSPATGASSQEVEVADPVPYHMENTPTGALSPIGKSAETPAQRV
jgi:hypothetical protein